MGKKLNQRQTPKDISLNGSRPEVKDLCELIDIAPMAAVDLLDMLTTAPKADELGPGAAAPVGKRCHCCFLVICSMVKDRSNWVDCCYHLFTIYLFGTHLPPDPSFDLTHLQPMLSQCCITFPNFMTMTLLVSRPQEENRQHNPLPVRGPQYVCCLGSNNVMWKKDEIEPHFFMIQPKKWGDPYMGWSVFRCFCC